MRHLEARLPAGEKLTPEMRQNVLDDMAKTASTDAFESYNDHQARLSDPHERTALLAEYAQEAMDKGAEEDAEEEEFGSDEPEAIPVKDGDTRAALAQAVTESNEAAGIEEHS